MATGLMRQAKTAGLSPDGQSLSDLPNAVLNNQS